MLINNHIIRDIVLSELTNEPLDKESQRIIDVFDNGINPLKKEHVSSDHIVWVDIEGRWSMDYCTPSNLLRIHWLFYKELTDVLYETAQFVNDDTTLKFLLERYLDVDCIKDISTELRVDRMPMMKKSLVY
tara:strand:- start:33539 stop:33931 length:393 start_codon:yes stop_codon:yes gene_type:complete